MSPPNPKTSTNRTENRDKLVVVTTKLGWIALVGSGVVVKRVTFAHPSSQAAVEALEAELRQNVTRARWNDELVQRLVAFAEGVPDDFLDVKIDLSCRRIPYGQTLTYGQLAAKAGSPRAARAVGQCMAANRVPLIVPCHRVVPSTGGIGPFSAPGGSRTKQRLLALEAGR